MSVIADSALLSARELRRLRALRSPSSVLQARLTAGDSDRIPWTNDSEVPPVQGSHVGQLESPSDCDGRGVDHAQWPVVIGARKLSHSRHAGVTMREHPGATARVLTSRSSGCRRAMLLALRTLALLTITGSQTGSQRPQARGHAAPRPAILAAVKRHVRPHLATPGHVSGLSPKQ